MPTTCVVPGCGGLGGFSFPKDPELNVKWRTAVKKHVAAPGGAGGPLVLWKPSASSRVCHSHFKPDDFKETLTSVYSANPKVR